MTGQQLNLFNAAHSRPRPHKTEKEPPLSPLDIAWGDKVAEWFRVTEHGDLRPWLVNWWSAGFVPPEERISDDVFALVGGVLDAAALLG
jgi:hypothetical protein